MLKQQIQKDFIEAFKAKDENKTSVLKMLRSSLDNAEIEKRTKLAKAGEADLEAKSVLTDEEALEVIGRELKKRKEAAEAYEKAGRADSAEKERKEGEVLSAYLPEQMGEEEIRELAKKAVEQAGATSAKDLGKVMGIISPQTKGRADGGTVSKIVRELLG